MKFTSIICPGRVVACILQEVVVQKSEHPDYLIKCPIWHLRVLQEVGN